MEQVLAILILITSYKVGEGEERDSNLEKETKERCLNRIFPLLKTFMSLCSPCLCTDMKMLDSRLQRAAGYRLQIADHSKQRWPSKSSSQSINRSIDQSINLPVSQSVRVPTPSIPPHESPEFTSEEIKSRSCQNLLSRYIIVLHHRISTDAQLDP